MTDTPRLPETFTPYLAEALLHWPPRDDRPHSVPCIVCGAFTGDLCRDNASGTNLPMRTCHAGRWAAAKTLGENIAVGTKADFTDTFEAIIMRIARVLRLRMRENELLLGLFIACPYDGCTADRQAYCRPATASPPHPNGIHEERHDTAIDLDDAIMNFLGE